MAKQTQKTSYIDDDIYSKIKKEMVKRDRSFNYILNDLLRKQLKTGV